MFTSDKFSAVDLLVEVGFFGFAMFVALIPTSIVLIAIAKVTPELEENDRVFVIVGLVVALLMSGAVRFGLFAKDLTKNLDSFGEYFAALVGVAVLGLGVWAVGQLKGAPAKE